MALTCEPTTIGFVSSLVSSLFYGIALIMLGVIILVKPEIQDQFGDRYVPMSIMCIVLGSLVFIIYFFGCFGAIRKSYCMIVTYCIFLFLGLLAKIAMVAYVIEYNVKLSFSIISAVGVDLSFLFTAFFMGNTIRNQQRSSPPSDNEGTKMHINLLTNVQRDKSEAV